MYVKQEDFYWILRSPYVSLRDYQNTHKYLKPGEKIEAIIEARIGRYFDNPCRAIATSRRLLIEGKGWLTNKSKLLKEISYLSIMQAQITEATIRYSRVTLRLSSKEEVLFSKIAKEVVNPFVELIYKQLYNQLYEKLSRAELRSSECLKRACLLMYKKLSYAEPLIRAFVERKVILDPIRPRVHPEEFEIFRELLADKGIQLSQNALWEVIMIAANEVAYEKFKAKLALTVSQVTCEDDVYRHFAENFSADEFKRYYGFVQRLLEESGLVKQSFQLDEKRRRWEISWRVNKAYIALAKERLKQRLKDELEGQVIPQPITINDVDRLDGHEFEETLEMLFKNMGYSIERPPYSRDKGCDLIVVKPGDRIAVQAKCYSTKVGIAAVQEIIGAVGFYRCDRGMVVTNNYFTQDAQELAQANRVELWDRDRLAKVLQDYPIVF